MDVTIRDETPDDEAAIREVNDQAFGQLLEGRLVEMLREHDACCCRWWLLWKNASSATFYSAP